MSFLKTKQMRKNKLELPVQLSEIRSETQAKEFILYHMDALRSKHHSSPLRRLLFDMAQYPEYEAMLDTKGLAYSFNEFVSQALGLEKLVLDHFEYKASQKRRRDGRRSAVKLKEKGKGFTTP